MATDTEVLALTEAHRAAQARVGARVALAMARAWRILDPDDLAGTVPQWLRAVAPIVAGGRALSSRTAVGYMTASKRLELGADAGAPEIVLPGPVEAGRLRASMLVTGPGTVARAREAARIGEAARTAQARATAAAIRHALNGGRDLIVGSVARDRQAVGWARATSGGACAFCRMLAARGPVYRSSETAGFAAHDGCACTAAPVWTRDTPWPAGARDSKSLWDETTAGLSGREARLAYRRAVEGRQ